MELLALRTPLLREGDDLATTLIAAANDIRDGDILCVSSKAVATTEGAAIDLASLLVTEEAEALARECGKTPAFRQAMLREIARLQGRIVRKNRYVVLTEVSPQGMDGSMLAASAGLDHSNAHPGTAIGWPHDPVGSCVRLRATIREKTGSDTAVILTDSCCRPRRLGVTAQALAVCGIDPFQSKVGEKDLFGETLRVTQEARADQLATAANFLMGNAAESTPAVLVRGHGLPFTDFAGWVPGIDEEEDMFSL